MRRKIVACIALGIVAVSPARADSAVTLYGIIDTGLAYIHNSAGHSSQWKMSPSNLSGSEWGLKGTEDLGGGLSAIFQIENGFDSSNGTLASAGRLFNRQAFVGVASPYGTLTLGRQYDPVTDTVQPLTADIFSGWFATPGDVDNYDDSARFNNAVKWVSPSWSGVTAEAMYAFGGVAGSTGSGQTWSGAVSYQSGSLNVAGGYIHIDNGNASASTRGVSTADSLFNSPVNAAYASARSINIGRVGGNYVIGSVTMGAAYSYSEYSADAASTYTGSEKYHNGSVFVQYQASP
jgi:predicted porin